MKPSSRIIAANRRERGGRRPYLSDAVLHVAIALLSLFGLFRRGEATPKVQMRLSAIEDARYREWARKEAAG